MTRAMQDYWRSMFGHFSQAAGRDDLLAFAKTAPLNDELLHDQIAKLRSLKAIPDNIVEMPNGGFVARYQVADKRYICLQAEILPEAERRSLEDYLQEFGATPELLDESTFMFLSLHCKEFYTPKREHLTQSAAESFLSVANSPEYNGHDLQYVISLFSEVMIFELSEDSRLFSCSMWMLAALLVVNSSSFRSEVFLPELADKLRDLLLIDSMNAENIYYAATSIHQRQCFMELYRCIEGLYYLPWALSLKSALSFPQSSRILAGHLKGSIGWRQKEKESISRLFSILSTAVDFRSLLSGTSVFQDMNFDSVSADAISRRIYKIRNVLVHQEDFDDPTELNISARCWPKLNLFLATVAVDLYSKYSAEVQQVKPEFELGEASA